MSRTGDLRARIAAATTDRRVVNAVHLAAWRKVDARAESFAKLPHVEALRDKAAPIR